MRHGFGVGNMVDAWNAVDFDDGAWQPATEYGRNDDVANYWQTHMKRPVDEVSEDARWIWTEDAVTHDSVFCRYVSDHKPIDCGSAASRYRNDYPEAVADSPDAWDAYQHKGKWEDKIWHSELCQADCHGEARFAQLLCVHCPHALLCLSQHRGVRLGRREGQGRGRAHARGR